MICQFVYHVSALAMNTVDAWTRLEVQQEEYCSTIYLSTSTLMTFCVAGNLMAILTLDSRIPVAHQQQKLFPTCELFTTTALALGFTVSVILRWYTCFREQFAFHVMVISLIVVVTIVVLLRLAASGLSLQVDNITPKPTAMPKTSLPHRFMKNKGIVLFAALFLMCVGVSVIQLVSPQAFHAAYHLLIVNAVVGIALPLTFKDFVDSNSELKIEIKTVVTS